MGAIVFVGIFVVGFGGAGVWMLFSYLRSGRKAASSKDWPEVEGRIEQSIVFESISTDSDGDDSSSYSPRVIYSYTVQGKSYQGDHVGFGLNISGAYSRAEKVVNSYQPGSTQTVYYNPQNPAEAVLERKVESKAGTLLIMIACLLAGAVSCVILAGIMFLRLTGRAIF